MCLVIDSFARGLPNYSSNVCVRFFFFSFFGGDGKGRGFLGVLSFRFLEF